MENTDSSQRANFIDIPEKLLVQKNVKYIILASIIAIASTMVFAIIFSFDTPISALSIELALLLCSYFINKKWRSDVAVYITVISMIIFIWVASFLSNYGTRDVVILIYPLIIIFTGLLVNQRNFLFLSFLVIISFNLYGVLELNGIINSTLVDYLSVKTIVNANIILILTVLCVLFLTKDLHFSSIKIAQNNSEIYRVNQKLNSLINSIPSAIITFDNNNIVHTWNPGAEKLFGWKSKEILNNSLAIIPHDLQNEYLALKKLVLDSDSAASMEMLLCKKDGQKFYSNLTSTKIYGTPDGDIKFLIIVEDITDIKKNNTKNEILFEISNAVVSTSETNELFEKIRNNLGRIIPVDNFYIALYDKSTNSISFPYFIDQFDSAPSPRQMGKGLTEYVINTGKPLLAAKNVIDKLSANGKIELLGSDSKEWLGVPLIEHGEIIGVMAAQIYNDSENFDETSLEVMTFTSNQVASAITKKLAEEKLAQQLDFSNSLLDVFPHKIYIKDIASRFIAVSKKYLQEYGHKTPQDIIGKTDFDIFDKDHAKQAFEDEQTIMRTGIPLVGKEEKEIWPDGTVKYVITTKAPWHNSKGEIVGTFGISFDITDRKNAEIERDRFFTIALEMLCIAGTDGYFKRVNPSFERILGYTSEELLSKPFVEFVHPDDRQSTLEAIQSLSVQKPVIDFENRYLCKDGTYKWILWIAAPYGDIMYSAAHDITERKKAEEMLAIEKRRLADILSGTNVGTWEWNIQTGELTINERWAEIIGYTLEEISPVSIETWNKFVHPEDLKASYNLIEKHFKDESEQYECEARLKHKNGAWIWVLDRGKVAIRDNDNKPLLMSGTHMDITERKRNEEILKKSEKKLREINATKDKFFSIIAHDLRSPFQGILSILDYMIDEFHSIEAEEVLANMQRLSKGLRTQLNLLEDLLHWGRLQSNNAKFEPRLDDLCDVIRESALFMSSLLSNKNIKLNIDIPENCPAYFDVNMISVVFRNLFSNAVKFSRPNSKIDTKLFQSEKEIIVTVRDYGIGMSKENLDRLFKIEQTFSTFGTLNESGSGLGLILCYEIINKHNGRIKVESAENEGTTFKVILNKFF